MYSATVSVWLSVIRGSIDLLARDPVGKPLVLDYKTDRLDRDQAEVIDRYSVQRDIYALDTRIRVARSDIHKDSRHHALCSE